MKELTVFELAAYGFIAFVAVAGISFALFRASEKRRESPWRSGRMAIGASDEPG